MKANSMIIGIALRDVGEHAKYYDNGYGLTFTIQTDAGMTITRTDLDCYRNGTAPGRLRLLQRIWLSPEGGISSQLTSAELDA